MAFNLKSGAAALSAALILALSATLITPGRGVAAPAENGGDWTGRDPNAEKSPGAQVYRDTCAACHNAGLGRAPQRFILQDMTPAAIHNALTQGVMRPQAAALSPEQKVAVAEYITGRMLGSRTAATALNMCSGARARFDLSEPPAFSGWGLDAASTHAIPSAISGLGTGNAPRLKLKWAFAFPDSQRARSQPALAGGAILVGNHNGSVYALDRETGCVRWAFPAQAEVRTGIVVSPWTAGDRAARPLVYFGDVAGNAYAVSLLDGRLAWKIKADTHPSTVLTGTPTLHAGTLYVPVSSNEEAFATSPAYSCCNFRGSVLALDARNGRQKWRTWLVAPPVRQGPSKEGLDKLGPSGVAVWNSPAIDVRRGQLYVATGDNYSFPATGLSDSIVALDLATGRIRWHYQATAGDAWNVACFTKSSGSCPDEAAPDFDFGAGVVLASGLDGKQFVLGGQKSGAVYALDPASGKLVWKTRVGHGSAGGGVHFGMAAEGGRLFVPISDRFAMDTDPFPLRPGLYALDIATGGSVWEAPDTATVCGGPKCLAGYGGSVTATGGLVIAGDDMGRLRIFQAGNGQVIWEAATNQSFTTVNGVTGHGGSISGGVAPIAYKGTVIVPSGYGFASKLPGNVLLVYGVE
ncbi:MAG: PQQ-binding-like beta-propeller repeat protein [Novosphingobium sp.]